jgi:hypothetical protein
MGESGMKRLEQRLSLVVGRGGCKHPDGTARFISTGLVAFADEVALHLARQCSVVRSGPVPRPGTEGSMPVPTPRLALVDVSGRDFE